MPRASFYRRQRPAPGHQQPRPTPARALRASERAHVLDVLASPRFVDRSPAEVVATLLDEGRYLCAERTMYRILAANQPVRERRNQRSHPCYTKPELVATGPNQTWSWDITRLRGLTTHQFLQTSQRSGMGMSRWMQVWMRRMPRLNSDVRLRSRLRGLLFGGFFRPGWPC